MRCAFHARRLAAACALLAVPVAAADWPGFQGPGRDGLSAETGLLRAWPEDGPEVVWRAPLGEGYSGVAVADGRAFTQFAEAGGEWVAAFDATTGEGLWRTRTGRSRADAQGGGPRATPTVDGGRVVVLTASAGLASLSAATGETIWSHDLVSDFGADVPRWGAAASPLIEGGLVLVPGGGGAGRAFLAFHKASGELAWSSGRGLPAYASPIAVTLGGVRQAVFFTSDGLAGVAVEDGEVLWRAPWRTSFDVNAATPLFVPASGFFVSSGYDTGAALLQVVVEDGEFEAYQVWRNRVMRNHFNSSVRVGQHVYGFDEGILKSVDVLTGKEAWRARAGGKGSLIHADGLLLVLGSNGQLTLVEATPEAYRELAQARIVRSRTWAPPALADGILYVRAWDELVALRVARPGP